MCQIDHCLLSSLIETGDLEHKCIITLDCTTYIEKNGFGESTTGIKLLYGRAGFYSHHHIWYSQIYHE